MISYVEEHKIKVYLEDKHVGTIVKERTGDYSAFGWRYYPKGNKVGGDLFGTLQACKNMLEDANS